MTMYVCFETGLTPMPMRCRSGDCVLQHAGEVRALVSDIMSCINRLKRITSISVLQWEDEK